MRFLYISFLSALLSFESNAQVVFSTVKHDFGELESYSSRYVDVILTNKSDKQQWLLSVKKPMEVVYITSKQIMEKDSSIIVRLHVNPRVKGRFSYDINIFTSDRDEATTVKISGNLKDLGQEDMSGLTSCPDFSERPGGKNPNNFDLTVVTIDEETREELSKSTVTMLQSGQPIWTNITDKNGKIKEEATLGLSYFYATHSGYYPAELATYVNFKRNIVIVPLEKDKTVTIPEPSVVDSTIFAVTAPQHEIEIIIEPEEHLKEELVAQVDSSITEEMPPSFSELDKENFDSKYFRPVNVVFVLDVSSSMNQVDKIELMKYSLFQLTEMIRPQDKIGIVTYASDARVLLESTSGDHKDDIKEEVSNLKAFGYTSGGSGIKLGFKEALNAKIENGTNHVIIITDGAFNRNSDDYKKYIKKYSKKGINMSVVGIKNKSVDEEEMREAAKLGKGHYIPIFKLADAQNNLKQEIRRLSYIF